VNAACGREIFWFLAFGFWLLAFGFWLLAFGFKEFRRQNRCGLPAPHSTPQFVVADSHAGRISGEWPGAWTILLEQN